jgi:hypothetical protein
MVFGDLPDRRALVAFAVLPAKRRPNSRFAGITYCTDDAVLAHDRLFRNPL